jgi:hypothetical protein
MLLAAGFLLLADNGLKDRKCLGDFGKRCDVAEA